MVMNYVKLFRTILMKQDPILNEHILKTK